MKIVSVDTFAMSPGRTSFFVVRVCTDNGITGWGAGAYFSYPEASVGVMSRFKTYLVGKDPLQVERHWSVLSRSSPFRGADKWAAVSAVDMALTDITGKHFGSPAYQLLGGKQRDKVRLLYLMAASSMNTIDELVKRAEHAVKEGFTAVKLDPIPANYQQMRFSRVVEEVLKRLTAVREAVGLDIDIGVEIHRKLVPGDAIALAQHLQPFRLIFYEDPIQPNSMDAQAQVTQKVSIPVAYGERVHNIYEFRDLLARDALHYVRADVGLAGGLTGCKKIATLAEAYHAGVVWHNFLCPLLTAASIQVDAAISNFTLQEYCMWDEEPPMTEMLKTPLKREGGYIIPPDAPGLGVEVNEEFLTKYPCSLTVPGALKHEDGSVSIH